jgi:hypothetical protein
MTTAGSGTLPLLVSHSFEWLRLARQRVLYRTGDDALLANRNLHVQRWLGTRRVAILRDCKYAQRQQFGFVGRCGRRGGGDCRGLLGIFLRRGLLRNLPDSDGTIAATGAEQGAIVVERDGVNGGTVAKESCQMLAAITVPEAHRSIAVTRREHGRSR